MGGQVLRIVEGFGIVSANREDLGSDGGSFVRQSFKRVRLTKKTPCALVHRVSAQPIPEVGNHDPLGEGSPGQGRLVARRVHGVSSPGSRLDREGNWLIQ